MSAGKTDHKEVRPAANAEHAASLRRAVSVHAGQQAVAKKMAPALRKQKLVGQCLLAGARACREMAVETGMSADQVSNTVCSMETKLWVKLMPGRAACWELTRLGRKELLGL